MTKRRYALGAGFLALVGLAVSPLVFAQDRPGGGGGAGGGMKSGESKMSEACPTEEVGTGKSIDEVRNKLRESLKRDGFILVAEVDWNKLESSSTGASLDKPSVPGGSGDKSDSKIGGSKGDMGSAGPGGATSGGAKAYTFLFVSNEYVNLVKEKPEKALWIPGHIAIYEKDGKCSLTWFRPTIAMEHHKKEASPEKSREIDEHLEKAKRFESKVEKVIDELKSGSERGGERPGMGGERPGGR